MGEFLATGIPVVINDGVGQIVRKEEVGVVLAGTSVADFERAAPDVMDLLRDPGARRICRDTASRHFELNEGIKKYTMLYDWRVGASTVYAGGVTR